MKTHLSLLSFGVLLMLFGGCSTPDPVQVPTYIPISVPAELRSCPALPVVPDEYTTQAGVADYVVQLHGVAMTCKTRLNAVDEILANVEASAS